MSRTMQDLFSVSSGKSTNGSARSTCDTGTLSCRIVHVFTVVTRSSGLYYPARNRWNGEVADDTDHHEDEVHPIRSIYRIGGNKSATGSHR